MADFGGEMRMTVDGTPFTFRGTFKLEPSRYTVTGITNQNSSLSRSFKPEAAGCDISLEDALAIDWDATVIGGPYAISVIEELTGVVNVFNAALFEGRPMVDRETGEVTGLKIRTPNYQRVSA